MGRALCVVAPLAGLFGPASGKQDCRQCYPMDMGVVVAIVVCDVILTVLIVLSVYCIVTRQKKRIALQLKANETAKEKMHTASKRARKSEITESPYQELYGVQSDIYNDLRQYQK
ncbi:TYRO protein tyrosine kinase-binding protein isoform X1 [Denticeps clupeoides]|uniref:TYRO protein tyrosine kinase-binding protein n=1 Tax=Denticeps clupeoides TaxID=299321 RepID=A0AAY4AWB3_9TELE|nr:TYRO protein tyrosine kinase-binding protein isoform X1 [Denticeps clupeoides]